MSLVFLSHHSADKPGVESLAFALLDRGIRPWFDKWDLTPGRPWIPELEDALRRAGAVLVCLGPHGLGRVQDPELQVALDQAWRDPERLVVPVMLPGFEGELPEFLGLRTWVDLRGGIAGDELGKLVRALEGRSPGPSRTVAATRPYQALDPFRERDAPRFFGRRRAGDELLARLRAGERLLVLLGASGSGKSSLLDAGLVPAVRSGELDGSYDWTIVKMRPGHRPCHELARCLLQARGPEPTVEELRRLRQLLRDDSSTLSDQADLLLEGEGTRLLLAVDQLEEVFTQAEAKECDGLVHNLLAAAAPEDGRVTVVTALRADFLGRALEHSRELAEAVKTSGALVMPMAEDELRDAVVRPAVQAGLELDDGLADTLVREVAGQPGDLPLLEFTLDVLWRERRDHRLSWEIYRRHGGLRGAIAHRAEAFLDGLAGDAERDVVRRLFGRLVHFGESGPETRRRASREELVAAAPGDAGRLVDRLIEERLLSAGEEGVEVAHEALIAEWPRLHGWVKEHREAWGLQEEVARAAGSWEAEGRSPDRLWRGGRLARLRELVERDQLRLAPVERELMVESAAAERRERDERLRAAEELAAAQAQSARRLRVGLGAAVVLLLAVAVAALFAVRERRIAEKRLADAVTVANEIVLTPNKLLEIPGTASVRRELFDMGKKLLEDLGVREGEAGSYEARHTQVGAHVLRGNLALTHENLDTARREYEQALEIAEILAQGGDPLSRKVLSLCLSKLGYVASTGGDLAAARGYSQRSLEIREALVAADPESAQAKRHLSGSLSQLGYVASRGGDLAAARGYFQRSLEIREELVTADPESARAKRDLSGSLSKLGKMALVGGDLAAARGYFQRSLEIDEALVAADPESAQAKRDLSLSLSNMGYVASTGGDLAATRGYFQRSLEIDEALVAADPENAQAKRDLSGSLSHLGVVASTGGNLAAARGYHQRSLEIDEALVAADPENAQAKLDLSVSLQSLAIVAMRLGELDRARQHLDRAFELSKSTADAHPTDPDLRRIELFQHGLALVLARQADDRDALRQHGEAIEEILTAFDARGLFRGDAQIEGAREFMESLRTPLDDMEP